MIFQSKMIERNGVVGVEDCVLLEGIGGGGGDGACDGNDLTIFLDNLRKRYAKHFIYTYIGPVLLSVNPYQELDIYSRNVIQEYRNKHYYETSPHIYAIIDNAYRALRNENRSQCILISGESGAGKTESSKKILQFLAETAGDEIARTATVKDQLIRSNTILESFGNAKTIRNDNSSRFGKYMGVEYDENNRNVIGGYILNYLLEKSRVIRQECDCSGGETVAAVANGTRGERNFHIFYEVLAGASDEQLSHLELVREPHAKQYRLLTCGEHDASLTDRNDRIEFENTQRAFEAFGFEPDIRFDALLEVVAGVLHLGDVQFYDLNGAAEISDLDRIRILAGLLQCDENRLIKALKNRTIVVNNEHLISPLDEIAASYARDALAKAIYDRLFSWIVRQINGRLNSTRLVSSRSSQLSQTDHVIGILDIYGFEVLARNSFEQFCINYCNEKLHQLFIELTLKTEQEEYVREGIEWQSIHYFDNRIICDLIEAKHRGIVALLDEECLRPGDRTDSTFLTKISEQFTKHEHFVSHATATDAKTKKTIERNQFRLVHYAGPVTYTVTGFLDKNNDLLFRDLIELMCTSWHPIVKELFCDSKTPQQPQNKQQHQRPATTATQFRYSLTNLMTILKDKEPWYVRCIKPNETKKAAVFDTQTVLHQVQYLGLMENLRVRRAGFVYRRGYDQFLRRYKCLCPQTWPFPARTLNTADAVRQILDYLQLNENSYRFGKTKLFLREPQTVFAIEDRFQAEKHRLAVTIQSNWRMQRDRNRFLRLRRAVITIQSRVRFVQAKRTAAKRRAAIAKLQKFIRAFLKRNATGSVASDEHQRFFRQQTTRLWLERLARWLRTTPPRNVLDKSWPECPQCCTAASDLLHAIFVRQLAASYCTRLCRNNGEKLQMTLKALAEDLFAGRKHGYAASIAERFESRRFKCDDSNNCTKLTASFDLDMFTRFTFIPGETLQYVTGVVKRDRNGYRARDRVLLVSSHFLYLIEAKGGSRWRIKHKLQMTGDIDKLVVTNLSDGLLLVQISTNSPQNKGDLILIVPNIIETVTFLVNTIRNAAKNSSGIANCDILDIHQENKYMLLFNLSDNSSVVDRKVKILAKFE